MDIFLDTSEQLEKRVSDLLVKLTINEKIILLRGANLWETIPIKRLKIPAFGMTDGPLGVAWHSSKKGKHTRFPATIALAATWDKKLSYRVGKAMGKETKLSGRHQILGPGVNIIRSPLCGRNFEYLSEDPLLSSEIGAQIVRGIQSEKVAACIKHYITNNSETERIYISTEIDERTLQEIYVKNYKRIIQKADPWGLMSSYNKINGVYASGNKYILRDILRDQLSFTGHVVTDWGASKNVEGGATQCIKAGLSLEMPGVFMSKTMVPKNIQRDVDEGKITESDIDYVVKPLLRTFFRVGLFDDPTPKSPRKLSLPEHQDLAQKVAEEGMVLLKNDGILPLNLEKLNKIAVIGPNATKIFGKPMHGGSSAVVPPRFITPFQGISSYVKGKAQLVDDPEKADIVVLILGLNHGGNILETLLLKKKFYGDTEGTDRVKYTLPEDQIELFYSTINKNPNTVVVLIAGSPVDCSPFMEKAPALLNAWYPGMMGGNAVTRVIFGDVNPSGKLPVTYPIKLEDHPVHKDPKRFPGDLKAMKIYYDDGIYVGYRYFDKENVTPLFPFGYGLSYTTFELSNLTVSTPKIEKSGVFTVTVDVKNTGSIVGAEVIQVYISDDKSSVDRPLKELQGFDKVYLEPGETKTAKIELDETAFEYYSVNEHKFIVEPGFFTIHVGTSSRDLPLHTKIEYLE